MDTQNFINSIASAAQMAMKKYRIIASVTIAQAAIESGWGDHAPGNNLFGIKASNGWTGKTQVINTTEYLKGRKVIVKDIFRAYGTWGQSIDDHGAFIAENRNYSNILGVSDYKTVCERIYADGYATDPDYVGQLISIIEQYRLYQYDYQPSFTTIDTASRSEDVVTVSGWALNMAGLLRVDVYYDSNHGVGSTSDFTDRPDVEKAVNYDGWYPDGGLCGFSLASPAGSIPGSAKTINVAAIGKDGSVKWAVKNIN